MRCCRMRCTERCFGYFEINPSDIKDEDTMLSELGGGACDSKITKIR